MTETPLERLYRRAVRASSKPSTDDERKQRIDDLWNEIHSGHDATDPDTFEAFLAAFIRKRHSEVAKDERTEKLCGCGNPDCNYLNGEIGASLKKPRGRFGSTKITKRDAREEVQHHPEAVVLHEALRYRDEKEAEVKRQLQRVISIANGAPSETVDIDEDNIPMQGEPAD